MHGRGALPGPPFLDIALAGARFERERVKDYFTPGRVRVAGCSLGHRPATAPRPTRPVGDEGVESALLVCRSCGYRLDRAAPPRTRRSSDRRRPPSTQAPSVPMPFTSLPETVRRSAPHDELAGAVVDDEGAALSAVGSSSRGRGRLGRGGDGTSGEERQGDEARKRGAVHGRDRLGARAVLRHVERATR